MRRLVVLNVLALFLCSLILLGCSTGSEKSISQSDIPDLIGKWEGSCFDSVHTELVTMQILNDSLEGKISFQHSQSGFLPTAGGAFTGKIENERLAASWEKDCRINIVKLRKDGGKMKLEGSIQTSEHKGPLTLEKIK